ncbi:male sterility protein-domain-containing protein [Polychytrium aggregatum]|uniref:male sterility protein-domain-containing protein n=1 Tax=Polychytrium aggregatum TaxID=110093 RepID=UPI0022FF0696|nr:male sterility protein-domain-containing protein [Polychytrium aggregatum]KAI9209591.1 male sterility protein-domain-containing protein [Polychytrium aggregatum]
MLRAISCCFGGLATPPKDRGVSERTTVSEQTGSSVSHQTPQAQPPISEQPQPQPPAAQPADIQTQTQTPVSQQPKSPPTDPFGPWLHPVECLINTARDEPDALLINTYESGISERLSYLRVWKQAYSVAQALKALPGWNDDGHEVIGTFCEAEASWVIYSFAVWMLGKKTLNLALNLPPAARKGLCERHAIKFILYHHTKPGHTEGVTLVDATTFQVLDDAPPPSLEVCEPLDGSVAYACTSGTTGIPKSFKYSHMVATVLRPSLGIPQCSAGLCQAPSFLSALGLILCVLNLKGSLWIPEPTPNTVDKVKRIVRMLDDDLSYLFLTPSFMKMTIKVALASNPNVQWAKTKKVSMGSELVPLSVVQKARALFPNAIIDLGYGSSESGLVGAFSLLRLPAGVPAPPKHLEYRLVTPGVRCLLFDEEGNIVDQKVSKSGVLVFAVDKDHHAKNHPNFVNADPNNKLAPFGFLEDGSPRVCTMDWVEMTGENQFTVIGRFDQKIKVNGVYVDLNALEELVLQHMSKTISDCTFVQTSEKQIVMLYVLQKGSDIDTAPSEMIRVVEDFFTLENVAKFPIHNVFELHEFPFNDSDKRDLKKLRRIAEHAKYFGKSVVYPPLIIEDTPLSRTAAKISTLGSQILDIVSLDGRNYYIGGVGFDSLSVSRLALAIKDEFDVEISPLILLSNGMTPLDVAQLVVDILDDKPMIPPTVDLAAEAIKLDDASVTTEGLPPFVYPNDPRGIVLTGATGFLGAFLVFELAHKFPRAKIYCLVRAQNEQLAFTRIFTNASKLVIASRMAGDPRYDVRDRFIGLCGDLSQDKWGLSDERWKEISEETDMIVHNGAEVHWLFDYDRLKGPNVLSTATALRLATTHHLKPLHYISTIGTIPMAKSSNEPLKEKIYSAWNISGGYGQTKWVSEQLINKARSRGVPVTIIRPAVIAGDSQYGVSNSDDYIWRYVKGCIQLGVAPSYATPVTMTIDPVDHVAKVVAEIAGSEESLSKFVFHISDSEHSVLTETKLFEIVNSFGWPVLFETREKFKYILSTNPLYNQNALFPLMHMMMDMSIKIDNANTRSIYPTPCPSTVLIAKKCLSYLNHARFLPNPIQPSSELKDDEYPEVSIFTRTGRN